MSIEWIFSFLYSNITDLLIYYHEKYLWYWICIFNIEVEVEVEVTIPIKNNYCVDYSIRHNRDILIFNYNTGINLKEIIPLNYLYVLTPFSLFSIFFLSQFFSSLNICLVPFLFNSLIFKCDNPLCNIKYFSLLDRPVYGGSCSSD